MAGLSTHSRPQCLYSSPGEPRYKEVLSQKSLGHNSTCQLFTQFFQRGASFTRYARGLSFTSIARYSTKNGSGVSSSEIQFGEQDAGHSSQSGESTVVGSKPYSKIASRRWRCGPSPIHFAHVARKLFAWSVRKRVFKHGCEGGKLTGYPDPQASCRIRRQRYGVARVVHYEDLPMGTLRASTGNVSFLTDTGVWARVITCR